MNMLNTQANIGISIFILFIFVLAGCGGSGVATYTPASSSTSPPPLLYTPPFVSPSPAISTAVAACAAEAVRGTPENIRYYCDCGAGAEANCKPGSDMNTGENPALPKQTIGNAMAHIRSLTGVGVATVALCKGGAFNSTGSHFLTNANRCVAGAACTDIREYTPNTFVGVAKPIINKAAGDGNLFNIWYGGGLRMLNIKLQSDTVAGGGGVMVYRGASDVTMCNLDMNGFSIAVYNESSDADNLNIKLTGSYITNTKVIGYLGGGNGTNISNNYWLNNGSDTVFNHTLYLASNREMKNIVVQGNYVRGQYGPICRGVVIVGHMVGDGLQVKDNVVDIAASETSEGCWGIAFTNITGAAYPLYHRKAIFSGNTVKNGGNLGLTVTSCPGCIIENNLIINETSKSGTGIGVAANSVRAGIADDVNDRNIIRNNTIWYGPNANNSGTGIYVGVEGTGHIITNNTITYSATATGRNGPFNCFSYPLPRTVTPAPYAFINNNHCQSSAPFKWEATVGSLLDWKISGFDTTSFTSDPLTANPLFVAAGTNFTLAPSSPLIGKGNTDVLYKSANDFNGNVRPVAPAIGAYEQ